MALAPTFADAPAGAWMAAVLQNVVRDLPGGRIGIDTNLLISMCSAEPKSAQIVMQMLAADIRTELNGRDVAQLEGTHKMLRLVLGSIFLAYCVSRMHVMTVPAELHAILSANPEIQACGEFVSADQERLQKLDDRRKSRPWWRFW